MSDVAHHSLVHAQVLREDAQGDEASLVHLELACALIIVAQDCCHEAGNVHRAPVADLNAPGNMAACTPDPARKLLRGV